VATKEQESPVALPPARSYIRGIAYLRALQAIKRACFLVRMRNIIMQRQLLASLIFTALFATSALAKERPVTDDERTKLRAAVTKQGCSGGKMVFDIDDNEFEVEDAKCNDGHTYDLVFDTSFKLIRKDLED
jgi:hypothetical protein